MKKKNPKKIRQDRQIALTLQQSLAELERDWEDFLLGKREVFDPSLLRKMAQDIQNLDKVSKEAGKFQRLKEISQLIHHLLCTPWGAPFTVSTTLLEAATAYSFQEPKRSDLCSLLYECIQYSPLPKNPFLQILEEVLSELKKSFF